MFRWTERIGAWGTFFILRHVKWFKRCNLTIFVLYSERWTLTWMINWKLNKWTHWCCVLFIYLWCILLLFLIYFRNPSNFIHCQVQKNVFLSHSRTWSTIHCSTHWCWQPPVFMLNLKIISWTCFGWIFMKLVSRGDFNDMTYNLVLETTWLLVSVCISPLSVMLIIFCSVIAFIQKISITKINSNETFVCICEHVRSLMWYMYLPWHGLIVKNHRS